MKKSTWAIVFAVLAIYGMFGIIQCDAVGVSAKVGDFYFLSGCISLALAFILGVAAFFTQKGRD